MPSSVVVKRIMKGIATYWRNRMMMTVNKGRKRMSMTVILKHRKSLVEEIVFKLAFKR